MHQSFSYLIIVFCGFGWVVLGVDLGGKGRATAKARAKHTIWGAFRVLIVERAALDGV